MANPYNQLTLSERYQIQAGHELGFSARKIALRLSRSNKTISQELQRCGRSDYSAESAQRLAALKRQTAAKRTKFSDAHKRNLDSLLDLNWTPEQIAGRMDLEGVLQAVSRQTLYRWVHRLQWRFRLPRKGKAYRKRSKKEAGARLIPDRVDIDQRPAIVEENNEIGHWEGDTVYGQDSYFVTLVERVSKVFLCMRVKNKTKDAVGRAIKKLLRPYQSLCKTITFDNGGEFAGHKKVSKKLKCSIYFAKPYSSWQRGLNENTNGLLRRYFPKGMAIATIPRQVIQDAVFRINTRPRKALNYLSPYEFLTGKRVSLIMGI